MTQPHHNAYENLMACISAGLEAREIKLVTGEQYDVDALYFVGWNNDKEFDGDWLNYFDDSGRYLGPDDWGLEPVFISDPEHAIRNLGEV